MPDNAPRTTAPASTDADVEAWTAVRSSADRGGPERTARTALFASGHPTWPLLLLLAARNTDVDDVVQVLHLEPGQLADVVNVAIPRPSPLPADEATHIPDEINLPTIAGGYRGRQRLTMDLPEAARLAALVPGPAGVILYCLGRGDTRHDVAEMLGVSVDAVDTVLRDQSGQHVVRPG